MTSSTTDRRLGLSGNAAIKTPCYAATTANITLSGEQTIDSLSVTTGKRVLVKNQTAGADNGVYVCDTGTWERDLDFDGTYDCRCGTLIFVTNGSANGSGLFQLTTADTITIGTTSLTFTKIATLTAGAVTQANVQNGQFVVLTSVAGTNTITASTVGTAPAALGAGQYVFFLPANTNTGATTLARDGFAALSIFYNNAALIGGELQASIPALLYEDGTQYHLIATAVSNTNYQTVGSVASATTINLNTAKPYSQITGSTGPIGTITLGNGRIRVVEFASTPTLTNSASLILPTGADIAVAAGDTASFVGEASSVVRCLWYQRANGNTVSGSSNAVRSYIAGLTLSTAGASSTMAIAAGQATDSTNSTTMTLSSALAKTTSAWAVGTGNGGLDSGAIGNSTWYHFYQISRTDTGVVDVIFSTNATSPLLPTNYTLFRRIGSGKTNGSANWVSFTQNGELFLWTSQNNVDVNAAVVSTTPSNQTLGSTPLGVSVLANLMGFSGSSGVGMIYPVTATDTTATGSFYNISPVSNALLSIMTSTAGQVRANTNLSTGAPLTLITIGYLDYRGKNS